jgi:hypothetical protein
LGSDDLVDGIRASLAESGKRVVVKVEYLDSKEFPEEEHRKRMLDALRAKYRKHPYDLLVTTDDYAFDLIEGQRDALFGSVPVVFCGTNYFDRARLAGHPDFVGIDESPSFADTLRLILRLHPGTRSIVAIHDDTETGRLNRRAFDDAAKAVAGRVAFSALAGLSLDDLLRNVSRLEPGAWSLEPSPSISLPWSAIPMAVRCRATKPCRDWLRQARFRSMAAGSSTSATALSEGD